MPEHVPPNPFVMLKNLLEPLSPHRLLQLGGQFLPKTRVMGRPKDVPKPKTVVGQTVVEGSQSGPGYRMRRRAQTNPASCPFRGGRASVAEMEMDQIRYWREHPEKVPMSVRNSKAWQAVFAGAQAQEEHGPYMAGQGGTVDEEFVPRKSDEELAERTRKDNAIAPYQAPPIQPLTFTQKAALARMKREKKEEEARISQQIEEMEKQELREAKRADRKEKVEEGKEARMQKYEEKKARQKELEAEQGIYLHDLQEAKRMKRKTPLFGS